MCGPLVLRIVGLVAITGLLGCSRQEPSSVPPTTPVVSPQTEIVQPLPAGPTFPIDWEVSQAWAPETGWLALNDKGWYEVTYSKPDAATDPLPVFRVGGWPLQGFAKLPHPTIPFGLEFRRGSFLPDPASKTQRGLEELAQFKQLRALTLAYHRVTDAQLKGIEGLEQLEYLDLAGNSITDDGLKHLAGLKNLRRLNLTRCLLVSEKGLKHLAGLERLEELELFSTQIPVDSEWISVHKKLKGLACTNAASASDPLAVLATMEHIESLALDGGWVNDQGLKHLAGLKKLRRLRADGSNVSLAGLARLDAAPRLEALESGSLTVTSDLARFSQLKFLRLSQCRIATNELKQIASLKNLRILHLSHNSVDDAALQQLVSLEHLRELDLETNPISDAGLKHLAAMPSLKVLNIGWTKSITQAGVEGLKKAKPGIIVKVEYTP